MVNTSNTLNKFNNELARLKNLGLKGFEPIEFKNPFLPGAAHDLWEIVIEKEAERIEKLFKIDDFMRDYNLTTLRKGELDQLYSSPEDRKNMGIITNVDYRNSLLNFIERIKEYNLISESEEQKVVKLAKENTSYVEELEKKLEELRTKVKDNEIEIETHLEAMEIAGKERWTQKEALTKDTKEKNKKLKSASEKVSYLESRVEKLEEESSQKSKKIEKLSKQLVDSESQNENLKWLDHLNSKPLPVLPIEEENKILTKQSIFKRLKTKAKVKIQKLQSLIKKEKFHNQELIARIEVSSK